MTTQANDEPEKVDLKSLDIAEEKRRELLRLFPEVRTEGGKIDFDRLKLTLGETVDVGRERYGMNWPGKAECFRTLQAPSTATLRPMKDESVNWDTTENLIIEGDNLEVLKLLQKAYQGKVKMIYIDPPYNTGNDFIYPDNYSESLQTYLEYTGQVDSEGHKFSNNTETDGRFHSKWLNMMYPRLYVAKNLLREDGVILISIDDAEVENLWRAAGEVFGEEKLIACMVWEKSRKNDAKFISVSHEYLLVYARSLERLKELKTIWREEKPGAKEIWEEYLRLRAIHGKDDRLIERDIQVWFQRLPKTHPAKKWARYRRIDSNGPWRDRDISWPGGDGPRYEVLHPVTQKPCKIPERGWIYSDPDEMQRQIRSGFVEFREDHTEPPFRKAHIRPVPEEIDEADPGKESEDIEEPADEEMATQVRGSYFYKQSQVAVKYLRKLMGAKVFDNPKDHEEVKRLIAYVIGKDKSEIVLDFFGGSGVTAEAVPQLNNEEETSHRFIVVQLPEPCNPNERSGKAALAVGLKTVSDITKQRVRQAIKRHEQETAGKLNLATQPKEGFRVLKLATSNFKVWNAATETTTPDALGHQLELHINHIQQGRSAEDLLYEILLKSSFPPTTPIETRTVEGKTVYSVAGYGMLICLEKQLTHELIKAMAERKPSLVVCLDEGFAGND